MSSTLTSARTRPSSPVSSLASQSLALVERTILNNPYIPQAPTIKQAVFLGLLAKEALFGGSAGGGKLLALDTPIPTPHGWRRLADVRPGDLVFGRDGQPRLVLAQSEVVAAAAWRLIFDDGSALVAHEEHRWLTFDAGELGALTRRDPAWRAARRERRPSRVRGTKSARFTTSLTARNQANPPPSLPPPSGTVRTTAEIVATLRTPLGRTNHAIPVAAPLKLPARELPLDPYLLGVWLGDGTSAAGSVTTMDAEIVAAFESADFPVANTQQKPQNRAATYRFEGLQSVLRELGVLGNKHIPDSYLWASEEQRAALLAGLLDTDGNVSGASVEFVSTLHVLTEGVAHLARSLGHKVRVREGRARLNGKDCGPKWSVKFAANRIVFRLKRKAGHQQISTRRTTRFRYIVAAERVEPVELKCIRVSPADGLFLAGEHLIPTHNSSALLMAALQFCHVPGYAALLLRKTYRDLALPGALMDRAFDWLAPTDAVWRAANYTWEFPSGATLTFGHLDSEQQKYRYQSSELQFIAFDELTQFRRTDYLYLFSRLRRLEGMAVPLRMRSASNPGNTGHDWVRERFPVSRDPKLAEPARRAGRVFVPSRIEDNPYLDQSSYRAALAELPEVERAQLEHGDWDVRPSGPMFQRGWFGVRDEARSGLRLVRAWDLAATPKQAGNDPDWTVGTLVGEAEGLYDVVDVVRLRGTPFEVERAIRQTAQIDGRAVPIVIEQEPGASSKLTIDHLARGPLKGFEVHAWSPQGTKVERARQTSAAAQRGHVALVRAHWNMPWLDEHEAFPYAAHDDQVDSCSLALTALSELIVGVEVW